MTKKKAEITWSEIERHICDWGSNKLFPSTDPGRDANCLEDAEYVISSPGADYKLCAAHFGQLQDFLEMLGIEVEPYA